MCLALFGLSCLFLNTKTKFMTKRILLFPIIICLTNLYVLADTPAGWHISGSAPKNYNISIDKGAGQNGKDVPTIKSIKEGKGFATLMQSCRADKYLGKRVRMSGYIKTENVINWAGFWFRVDGAYGQTTLSFDNMRERPIKGTAGWAKYDIVLDVPENAFDMAYGAQLDGSGQIWMDNLELDIVDNSVKTTGNFNRGVNTYILDRPSNLNFDSLDNLEQSFTSNPKQSWHKSAKIFDDYSIGIDRGAGINGTNAGTIKSVNNKVKGCGSISQNFKPDNYLGKRIRIIAYVRSKDLKYRSLLYAGASGVDYSKAHGYENKILDYGDNYKSAVKGTTDWTKCQVVIDVPVNTELIFFGCQLWGPGQIWLDNVSIETVDNSVKTTTNWVFGKPTKMQIEPTNLNFLQ